MLLTVFQYVKKPIAAEIQLSTAWRTLIEQRWVALAKAKPIGNRLVCKKHWIEGGFHFGLA
jgi:hypothetical protein